MGKLCFVLIFALLGVEVLSMSFRVKRQDKEDLEERYGFFPIGQQNRPEQNPPQNTNENNTQSPENCRLACPVTSEYNPVCGTDNVTYPNPGRLLCAQACGTNVTLLRQSRCPAADAASSPAPSAAPAAPPAPAPSS